MFNPNRTAARRLAAGAFAMALVMGGVACSDEDGDGAVTDEEVDQIDETVDSIGDDVSDGVDEVDQTVDSIGDELEEELDSGTDEVESNE